MSVNVHPDVAGISSTSGAGGDGVPASTTPDIIYGTNDAGAPETYPINGVDGVVVTDGTGKIPADLLPPLEHEVGEAASQAAMLALAVNAPAVCIRTDFTPPHVFYLTADPASTLANWHDTGEFGAGGANPTALAGPAVINGVASTFMRSDAAPAINQAAAYTWSGAHVFTSSPVNIKGATTSELVLGDPSANDWSFATSASGNLTLSWDSTAAGGVGYNAVIAADSLSMHRFYTGINLGDLRFTISATDLLAGTSYTPANAKSLVTKDYVDALLPKYVAEDARLAQTANVNAQNFYEVTSSALYRVSAFVVVTQAATTSCVVPSVTINYTEASTGVAVGDLMFNTSTTNQLGSHIAGSIVIQAQQGSSLSYVTSNYASVGATPMQYSVRVLVEKIS